MPPEFTKKIFASRLLDTREKWIIIRAIKNGELSQKEIEGVIESLEKEGELIKSMQQETDEKHLKEVEKWHHDLEKLYHKHVVYKTAMHSNKAQQEDAEAADRLIQNL